MHFLYYVAKRSAFVFLQFKTVYLENNSCLPLRLLIDAKQKQGYIKITFFKINNGVNLSMKYNLYHLKKIVP